MKYIIVNSCGHESAILFPDHVTHSQAVNKLQVSPISAGYWKLSRAHSMDEGHVHLYGDSTSLTLKPRPQDAYPIAFALWQAGLLSPGALLAHKQIEIRKSKFENLPEAA